jgi:hypothetical protein
MVVLVRSHARRAAHFRFLARREGTFTIRAGGEFEKSPDTRSDGRLDDGDVILRTIIARSHRIFTSASGAITTGRAIHYCV